MLIILLPIIIVLVSWFTGRWIGRTGVLALTSAGVGVSWLLAVNYLFTCLVGEQNSFVLSPWIQSDLLSLSWGFHFDSLTAAMFVLVLTVSFIVHLYSIAYMGEDPGVARFFSYLSFFTVFMLILVASDNLMLLFMGWEGVGLCSYLLINFWFTRLQANKAAMKAIIVNRVGDYAFVLALVITYMTFRSVNFDVIFSCSPYVSSWNLGVIGLLLVIAATGKSAQFGLHTWLPDAMEGPTPVSALIHIATMVTAGLFLLIRCSPLLSYAGNVLAIMAVLGAVTALFSATVGMTQNDIKRVIAYSTCSQLGYMLMIAGLSQFNVSLFHLYNHGYFKALLFLSAGSIIHALGGEQDMRRMGGLAQRLPFLYVVIMIASLALMGIPFLTGFFSKDTILEIAFATGSWSALIVYWLGGLAAILTAFYSFRLLYLTFWVRSAATKTSVANQHPVTNIELGGLSVLILGSLFIGFMSNDFFNGVGTDFFGNNVASTPATVIMEMHTLPVIVKLLPFIVSTGGALAAVVLLSQSNWLIMWSQSLLVFKFLANKWYFNLLQNIFVSRYILVAGHTAIWLMDRYVLEQIGSAKHIMFGHSKTLAIGPHQRSNYVAVSNVSTQVDQHFAARFYTWTIWSWARATSFPLISSSSYWMNILHRYVVFWKLTLWTGSLFWRSLNSGFIPDLIASMLYVILLGFGVSILFF
jgi:proton-translocating NADH-quinone oxidoreductase chain L